MAKAKRSWSWRSWLPDVSAAYSRFPLAVMLAAFFTIYNLAMGDLFAAENKVVGTLAASFLWVVAVDLFCEAHEAPRYTRGIAWFLGVAAIALLFQYEWQVWLWWAPLYAALILAVGLAGYAAAPERNGAFWLFNHRLWLAALLALVGAALFGAGLSIILESLNFLFNIGLPTRWHEHIWTIALGFFAPVSWLALAPAKFGERVSEGEQTEFTTRAVASLVKYVLVPLLLVYTAILYAYAVKIGLERTLPRGTLGSMVVGYLLTGAATLLLAYPTRESGGALVRLFWRWWVWLSVMPVLLLFLAIYTRISAYGLTESRYLMVLIGVWALILAVWRLLRPQNFDLRLAPAVLAVMLLIASFGPWGAIGTSVSSQKAQLARLLEAKGLLVDGKIVPKTKESGDENPLGTDAARARGLQWYLNAHHALRVLEPWFAGREPNPFAEGKEPEQTSREILAALSLRADIAPSAIGATYFSHYSNMPETVNAGAVFTIGPVVFEGGSQVPTTVPPKTVTVEGLGTVRLALTETVLSAQIENGPELKFDILDAARRLSNPFDDDHRPVRLTASGSGFDGVMLIDNFNGTFKEPTFDLSLLRFWLVLEKKG